MTMQTDTNWQKVKDAILRDRKPIEELFQLKVGKEKGEWSTCRCPLHDDSESSASLSRAGGLRCHAGCTSEFGEGADIFQWVAKLEGITQVQALEKLGTIYHIDTDLRKMPARPRAKTRLAAADDAWAAECCKALVESEDPRAAFYRHFLRDRHLDPALVAQNDVGYDAKTGLLVFIQRDGAGAIQPYWRTFEIVNGEKQWRWTGNRNAMNQMLRALWPLNEVERIRPGDEVWIVEGEWDALTARCRLRWQDGKPAIHVLSVTHGKSGLRLPAGQIPAALSECKITVAFDNDVWQTPIVAELKAPSAEDRTKLQATQESFLSDVGALRRVLETDEVVRVAAVPLPGDTNWKADLRDWCDVGGCDPRDWTTWRFDDLDPETVHPEPIGFDQIAEHLGKLVVFEGTVDAMLVDNVVAPDLLELVCDAGSKPYCATCNALQRYQSSNWMIQLDAETKRRYALREGRDLQSFQRDTVLGRPKGCIDATLEPRIYDNVRRWGCGPRIGGSTERSRSLIVLSRDAPPMSGNVRVTGWVMQSPHSKQGGESVCIYADKVEPIERVDIDIADYHNDLLLLRGEDRTVADIDQTIHDYVSDVSSNLTHIYGLDEMHIGVLLTLASVLWLPDPDGGDELMRGWIDSIYFGDTGAGKTPIAKRMFELVGGMFHSSPGNTSRAGFVIGSLVDNALGGYVTKIGTLVKNNGGALAVDEAQLMPSDVFDACQSARANGIVKSGKAGGGDRVYEAAVRMAWLANWIKGARDNYRFACEHVMQLCGLKDESVRRFDFALAVASVPEWESTTFPHKLKPDLIRALIGRAWLMKPTDIDVEEGAWALAKILVRAEAHNYWQQEVPLFITSEKDKSVMRIACAVANLLYSHPEGKPNRLLVRRTHVEWAMLWLKRTFVSIEYDQFSRQRAEAEQVACPFFAEGLLTIDLSKGDVHRVKRAMESLGSNFTQQELDTLFTTPEAGRVWTAKARQFGVINRSNRLHPNRSSPTLRLTAEAQEIRNAWITLLNENEMAALHRVSMLRKWRSENPTREPGASVPEGLLPLTNRTLEEILSDDYPDREEDIGKAEPMF